MTRSYDSPRALLDEVGTDLGVTEWVTIEQQRIDAFADATDDHQWIHVDLDRARGGPFGSTIAHGHLTLSLLVPLSERLLHVGGTALVINAGLDRVRFLAPVRSTSRIRARGVIAAAQEVETGVRVRISMQVDLEGADKPALVAETLTVFAPHPAVLTR